VVLRDEIAWFEKRPLFGKRVVVTRATQQAPALTDKLAELGAEVMVERNDQVQRAYLGL